MNKKRRNKLASSTYLFSLIKISSLIYIIFLFFISLIFPAPLGAPGNYYVVKDTIKAAWFLIWIQELISHSLNFVYLLIFGSIFLFCLPFIKRVQVEYAKWFNRELKIIHLIFAFIILIILILTIIGMFFRGENWQLKI